MNPYSTEAARNGEWQYMCILFISTCVAVRLTDTKLSSTRKNVIQRPSCKLILVRGFLELTFMESQLGLNLDCLIDYGMYDNMNGSNLAYVLLTFRDQGVEILQRVLISECSLHFSIFFVKTFTTTSTF